MIQHLQHRFLLFPAAMLLASVTCNLPGATTPSREEPAELTRTSPSFKPAETMSTKMPTQLNTPRQTTQPIPKREPITSAISPTPVASLDGLLSTCPSTEEIDRFQADFDIVFDPDLGLTPYSCEAGVYPDDADNARLMVFQALRTISALRFNQLLPWTDASLYDWLQEAIESIVLTSTSTSYCCDSQNRIVLRAALLNQPSYTAWYNQQSGIGLMSFVGLLVHEARHAENGGHTCDGINDETLDELGAWGVQYYLYLWMAEHSPAGLLTPVEREGATAHASTALGRICNP
jgi:hypothetical protein